jgi:hypothetical protein
VICQGKRCYIYVSNAEVRHSAIKRKAEVVTADENADGIILTTRIDNQYSCSVFKKLLMCCPDMFCHFFFQYYVAAGIVLKLCVHTFLPNPYRFIISTYHSYDNLTEKYRQAG